MIGRLATAAAFAAGVTAQIPEFAKQWAEHATGQSQQFSQVNGWISPEYTWLFEFPMPIPETAVPVISTQINDTKVEFFNATIDKFTQQIYPNLGLANLVGYNATTPGPTFRIQKGTQSIHRWTNNGDTGAAIHTHGSHARSAWDGWASDTVMPGQYKDYYYPNSQGARTLWYHDHAESHTSEDAYYGQTGSFIIEDVLEDSLELPTGKYDFPIMMIDKIYGADGDLVSPENETMNFFGDVMHVNGQPWPYHQVEPRKYRLRLLNCALSRPLQVGLSNDVTKASETFQVIASDAGLFNSSVPTSSLYISMGERYDIIVDFADYVNTNLTLTNSLNWGDVPQYAQTNQIMRFVVGDTVTDWTNNELPDQLMGQEFPPARDTIDHTFSFDHKGQNWTINGADFDDITARTLARPPQGDVETWELRYASGPGFHPVHIHLVQFHIISREGGRGMLEPYETAGYKDVVLVAPGEVVTVTAKFGPQNGLYMFHCHNLVHEDHLMMDAFNVTANPLIAALGYGESQTFDNPMDERFSPKIPSADVFNIDYVLNTEIPNYVNSGAYKYEDEIKSALVSYYSTATYGETLAAPTQAASTALYEDGAQPTNFILAGPAVTASVSETIVSAAPSSYAWPAPFTFTDSVPTHLTAMSVAVVQATNTASVNTIHFSMSHSWGPPAPSGQQGPPGDFTHPTGPPAQAAAPTVVAAEVAPSAPATTPAAAPAPVPTTEAPAQAPPAAPTNAPSWGPPAGIPSQWQQPSEVPQAPPQAAPSQPAPAPPAAVPSQWQQPSEAPQAPSQAAPSQPAPAPPAAAPTQEAPPSYGPPSAPAQAPSSPAWSAPPQAAPSQAAPAPPAAAPTQEAPPSYGPPSAPAQAPSSPPWSAPPQAAPSQAAPAPPAAAPTQEAPPSYGPPSAPSAPPQAPPAPAWTPPAQAAPENHPGAPGFFSGSNSAPQAPPSAPQAPPQGPPSGGQSWGAPTGPPSGGAASFGGKPAGGAPAGGSFGGGHAHAAVVGSVDAEEAAKLPGVGVAGGLKTGAGRRQRLWKA